MRQVLVLLLVAALAAACAKKQSPAAKSPAPGDQTQDADKATGGAPDTEATPRSTSADPCEGGEN